MVKYILCTIGLHYRNQILLETLIRIINKVFFVAAEDNANLT